MLHTAASHHGNAHTDDNNWQSESTKAKQPTKSGVDAATQWASHAQIHGENKNDAGTDEANTPELDLTATNDLTGSRIGIVLGLGLCGGTLVSLGWGLHRPTGRPLGAARRRTRTLARHDSKGTSGVN